MRETTTQCLMFWDGSALPQDCPEDHRIFFSPPMVGARFQEWTFLHRNNAARMLRTIWSRNESAGRVIRWQRIDFHINERPATRWAVEVEWH